MKRQFLLPALFLLSALASFGQGFQVQSKYFVYLQTEPAQPFYIRINNQKMEANASGYLILPQLKDGDYKLIVGFPQGKTEEQAFNFKIDSKDKGYLIKDYGAEGWGLFDLQTMSVQKAIKGGVQEVAAVQQPVKQPEPQKDQTEAVAGDVSDFTKLLSQAANDPSLLEKPKPQPVEEKPVVKEEPTVVAARPDPVVEKPVTPDLAPSAPSSGSTAGMVKLVYDERNESGQVDPITIFIPAPNTVVASQPASAEKKEEVAEVVEVKEEPAQPERGFNVLDKRPAPPKEVVQKEEKVAVKTTNTACKSVAGEDDFLKLRRTMASEANDDGMIAQAKKAFASKCYTTSQVKYLSSMFLSNAGKYNFYAAAYSHIADRENFASLEAEIKDPAYKEKFGTLLQ